MKNKRFFLLLYGTRFSISSFFYSIVVLVTIWQIVFEKIKDNDTDCEEDIKDIEDIKEPFLGNMKLCQFLEILVTVFIVTCIIARWIFPTHNRFRREDLVSVLMSFIINGTDIIDFFGYVDEERIFVNKILIVSILIFFSISVLQFSFTLSARLEHDKPFSFHGIVFSTEIWSIALVFIFQDFPFCIIRTIIIAGYGADKNYLLYFFVVKNYILCLLEFYMVINILLDKRHDKKQETKINMTKFKNLEEIINV